MPSTGLEFTSTVTRYREGTKKLNEKYRHKAKNKLLKRKMKKITKNGKFGARVKRMVFWNLMENGLDSVQITFPYAADGQLAKLNQMDGTNFILHINNNYSKRQKKRHVLACSADNDSDDEYISFPSHKNLIAGKLLP